MLRIILPVIVGVLLATGLVFLSPKLREKSLLQKMGLTLLAGFGISILINAGLEVAGITFGD